MSFTVSSVAPSLLVNPAFIVASEILVQVSAVAEQLPPTWRFLAVHLRRQPTLILQELALAEGIRGKRRRKLLRRARLRAFDLVGSLRAVASLSALGLPGTQEAARLCVQFVKIMAAFV